MRIVIDLQACQTEFRHRGIGRYSLALARAIAKQQGKHELRFTLNNAYEDVVDEIKEQLIDLVSPAMFSSYRYPHLDKPLGSSEDYRRPVAEELVRRHYAQLRPDVLHISSVFEGGWGGKAIVPKGLSDMPGTIRSATLYDLIPLIMSDIYLQNNAIKSWYHRKLSIIKECDLLLAISEASRKDASEYLSIPTEKIVNISGAADAHYRPIDITPEQRRAFLQQYGIQGKFVLYTGALDYRKNVEGAITGYARLPQEVRQQCQLVIVCSMETYQKLALFDHAAREGLDDGEVVLTGFVPDDDLVLFYNLCTLFIFPSLYEGFGLPILEAMNCGAPVLGADNSSIPEIIGRRDALFDGKRPEAIAQALYQGLTDEEYRTDLQSWSRNRAKAFSWESSASKALAAFEEAQEKRRPRDVMITAGYLPRRKMAYFSPLPGQESDIAAYSARLLPDLARYYDIDLFSDAAEVSNEYIANNFQFFSYQEFAERNDEYDVVLYQLANSSYHTCMYEMLQRFPGIVVLHDFFLGGMLQDVDATEPEKGGLWGAEMEYSHGNEVRWLTKCPEDAVFEYPCNRRLLEAATGIIVHSQAMIELTKKFYPQGIGTSFAYIDFEQHPSEIAAQYAVALERFTQQFVNQRQSTLIKRLGEILVSHNVPHDELEQISSCVFTNTPNFRPPRILIDVSQLTIFDHHSGIQRVVKSIVETLCDKRKDGFCSIPVQLHNNKLLRCENMIKETIQPIINDGSEVRAEWDDILLMLDSSWEIYDNFRDVFTQVHHQRGSIYTVVYDLIPILYPHLTSSRLSVVFPKWIQSAVQHSDGLVCISKAVADDLVKYIQENKLLYNKNLKIGYFHLGADFKVVSSESFVRSKVRKWFNDGTRVFLIVGWIDRRKGQDFALDAFEKLWNAGVNAKLIFAGKENLHRKEFIDRIFSHQEYAKRLLWVDNPTDTEIIYCYRHAAALLFPSIIEGFGLPLIEAAHHGLPIICSDIPVFREIAGDYATYFSLESSQHLADVLRNWLKQPHHLDPDQMPRLTWEQSAGQLLEVILNNKWYQILPPDELIPITREGIR